MKLYDVPQRKGVKIKILPDNEENHPPAHRDFDGDEILTFDHLDGMYSLCFDKEGQIVHLAGHTEVEIVE